MAGSEGRPHTGAAPRADVRERQSRKRHPRTALAAQPPAHGLQPSRDMKHLQVKVKPNARRSVLEETSAGLWHAELKSAPVDGKANRELIALVAKAFGCPRAAVSIRSGAAARLKLVRIEDD
jgi:uncharacterized protein (TIGR00251 family)